MKKILFLSLIVYASVNFAFSQVDFTKSHAHKCRKNTKQPEVITVLFCELVKNPKKYVGDKLEVSVTYRSGFMMMTLLSDSRCGETVLYPKIAEADRETYKNIKQAIDENVFPVAEYEGTIQEGTFSVIGELKKSDKKIGYPVKGLLDDYYFLIESVVKLKK